MKSPVQRRWPGFLLFDYAGRGLSCLTVGTEDVLDLVLIHLLHLLTGGLQILAGIEVSGILGEVLADGCGHGKTAVRVDVDLADCALGGLAELLLGNSDCIGKVSAILVAHIHIYLGN